MRFVWHQTEGGVPGEQDVQLFGPFWANVGPDDSGHSPWSWFVYDIDSDDETVAYGYAFTRHDAKEAVIDWAVTHLPHPWKRRLRRLRRRSR